MKKIAVNIFTSFVNDISFLDNLWSAYRRGSTVHTKQMLSIVKLVPFRVVPTLDIY